MAIDHRSDRSDVRFRMSNLWRRMTIPVERFVPGQGGSRLATEHLSRYLACEELARGKRVLDAASGSGYGTAILARDALRATGLDISKEAVDSARGAHQAENLEYVVGSITDIPFEDGTLDLLVSFETLEHVPADAQSKFIAEARRVLAPDGLLVISTPDRNLTNQDNEYHVQELSEAEFMGLLRSRFDKVDLYFQNIWEYTEIIKAGETPVCAQIHMEPPPQYGLYMIAVCSVAADLPRIDALLRSANCDTASLYEQSLSWRITAPLRQVKGFLKRGHRKH